MIDFEPPLLSQHEYVPDAGLQNRANLTDNYLIVLPYSRGALRATREREVIHNGLVGPGTVRIIRPGERSSTAATKRFEAARVDVSLPLIEAIAGGPAAIETIGAMAHARGELRLLVPALVSALDLRDRRRDLVVDGITRALLALVLVQRPAVDRERVLSDTQRSAAAAYAHARLRTGLSTSAWAAEVGLHAGEFSRRFRVSFGVAPYSWFMDQRIQTARALLATTDLSILDVAHEVGFRTQSHFTDAFARRTGTSPARWRNARRWSQLAGHAGPRPARHGDV